MVERVLEESGGIFSIRIRDFTTPESYSLIDKSGIATPKESVAARALQSSVRFLDCEIEERDSWAIVDTVLYKRKGLKCVSE